MKRMIVEGMDPDNTRINYVAYGIELSDSTTVIESESPKYSLNLVGRINECGDFIKEEPAETIEEKMRYMPIGMPESIQTIIVEDGRVYSCAKGKRLQSVITDFKQVGGFENVYRQVQDDPGKFYNGAIRIKDGVIEIVQKK